MSNQINRLKYLAGLLEENYIYSPTGGSTLFEEEDDDFDLSVNPLSTDREVVDDYEDEYDDDDDEYDDGITYWFDAEPSVDFEDLIQDEGLDLEGYYVDNDTGIVDTLENHFYRFRFLPEIQAIDDWEIYRDQDGTREGIHELVEFDDDGDIYFFSLDPSNIKVLMFLSPTDAPPEELDFNSEEVHQVLDKTLDAVLKQKIKDFKDSLDYDGSESQLKVFYRQLFQNEDELLDDCLEKASELLTSELGGDMMNGSDERAVENYLMKKIQSYR